MATPVWQSAQTANVASASALTITKPASTVSGDLLVAFVQINAGAGTVTPPAGWTLIRQDAGGSGTAVNLNSYWKIAGGSEPADYTWTRSGSGSMVGSVSRITGSHGTTPVDAHNGQYNAASTSATAPSVTTTGTERLLVFACVAGGGAQAGVTPPVGMTERWEVLADTARNHEGATEGVAAIGATGTRAATLASSAAYGAQLVAIRPLGSADAGFPTTVVEIAFASDPNVEAPTWTDITSDVRYAEGVTTNRGRQRELDTYQAGRCSYVLNNRDRAYDDQVNAAAKPMKRTRIRASYAGTTYPVFDGFIDQFALNYGNPREATAEVTATDGFKVLAAADLASSAYAQEVLADGPVAWWRLDETDTDAVPLIAHDSAGDVDLIAWESPVVGGETLIARDPGAAASLAIADGFEGTAAHVPVTGGPLTIEVVVRLNTAALAVIAAQISELFGAGFSVEDNPPKFTVAKSPGVFQQVTSTLTLLADTTYHIVGVWAADGSLRIYINGADVTTGSASLTVGAFSQIDGRVIIGASSAIDDGIDGLADEVAFYDYALSSARISAHHEAISTPWNNDTPVDRVNRVLDAVGWPDALRSNDMGDGGPEVAEGSSTLQSANLDMSALDHLRKVAASEFGDVFITRAGEVRLVGRVALTNRPELYTFTDDDPTTQPSYASIGWDSSDQLIRNDVTVSRNEGVAQRVEDQTSINTYLRHSYVADGLIHDSDIDSRHAAEFIAAEYSQHKRRITQMTMAPTRNPLVMFPAVLGVELGDEVTVVFNPPGGGTPFTQDSRIEGIAHRFTSTHWETTFSLSPAYADDFLELDAGPENAGLDSARLFF